VVARRPWPRPSSRPRLMSECEAPSQRPHPAILHVHAPLWQPAAGHLPPGCRLTASSRRCCARCRHIPTSRTRRGAHRRSTPDGALADSCNRILATAASLLVTLGNPHNLSLLTSHLLTAPALWDRPDGVRTSLRLLSVFHSTITTVINYHNDVRWDKAPKLESGQLPTGGGLSLDDWIRAIVAGADNRSQRWKHLIVLGGLLIGIGNLEEQGMDLYWVSGVRRKIEGAFVNAVNLALVDVRERSEVDGLGGQTITLALNHAFGCLNQVERSQLDYDLLLPVLIGTSYYSNEGFQSAYFLGGLDLDIGVVQGGKLSWNVRPTCRS
jgi:hypothetical protein